MSNGGYGPPYDETAGSGRGRPRSSGRDGAVVPRSPGGAPDLARPIPTGTWPVAGHDPARPKHASDATPPATDIRVAWTAAVPLSAWNPTVTADEDAVYVAEPDGVTALDAADGRVRWRFDTADHWPLDVVSNGGDNTRGRG